MRNNANLKLSTPWAEYYRQLEALFAEDPDIRVEFDDANYKLTLYVDSSDKYNALVHLLPETKEFGNVNVKVVVVPANTEEKTKVDYIKDLFKGNKAVSRIVSLPDDFALPLTYVAFNKEVIQYFLDNLHDINGNCSTLLEAIAKEVLGEGEGICFCTDEETND